MAENIMEGGEFEDSCMIAETRGAQIGKKFLKAAVSLLRSESISAPLYHSFTTVEVVTWVMMAYLIDVGGHDITHAAGVIALWSGSVPLLAIVFQLVANTFTGKFPFVLLGLITNTLGLVIMTIATTTKTTYIYVGLVFILVGLACRESSLDFIIEEQIIHDDHNVVDHELYIKGDQGSCGLHKVETGGFSFTKMAITFLFFLFCFDVVDLWFYRFMLGAALMVVITLLVVVMSSSTWTYKFDESRDTSTVAILPSPVAKPGSPSDSSNEAAAGYNLLQRLLPTPELSCAEEGMSKYNDWSKICTKTESLIDTKLTPCLIPICIALLVSGLVSFLGETYFIVQALHLDKKLGSLKFSIYILFAFQKASEYLFAKIFSKHNPTKGIILAMVYSTLCCITAALVETRMLNVLVINDQSLSVFWLVPQFILLGGFKTVFEKSIERLLFHQKEDVDAAVVINDGRYYYYYYITSFAKGLQGLGKVGSVALVYVMGKMGESYGEEIDCKCRLDSYYWVLASFSAGACVLLCYNLL